MNTALGSFYDAAQIALRLKYVSEEKLVQWAEAGYVPSYYIDECGPLFKIAEVVAWMKANAIRQRGGLEFP